MDLSDGLADGVRQIADASGVGVTIDASALPIEAGGDGLVHARSVRIRSTAALCGGDDYELLFTVRPRQRGRLNGGDAARRRAADTHRRLHRGRGPLLLRAVSGGRAGSAA